MELIKLYYLNLLDLKEMLSYLWLVQITVFDIMVFSLCWSFYLSGLKLLAASCIEQLFQIIRHAEVSLVILVTAHMSDSQKNISEIKIKVWEKLINISVLHSYWMWWPSYHTKRKVRG
jgi:hypothetical protein